MLQGSFEAGATVPASTTSAAPLLLPLQLFNFALIAGTSTGVAVTNSTMRVLRIKKLLWFSNIVFTGPAGGVAAVTATAQVAEALYVDQLTGASTLAAPVLSHPTWNPFGSELGSVGVSNEFSFPKRILLRRFGITPVGALQTGTGMPQSYNQPSWREQLRLRFKANLTDSDSLQVTYAFTNPTLVNITFAVLTRYVVIFHAN